MNPAVVTDFSFVSPLGKSKEEFCENLFAGHSGIRDVAGLLPSGFPIRSAGIIGHTLESREPLEIAEEILRELLQRSCAGHPVDGLIFFISPRSELSQDGLAPPTIDEQAKILNRAINEITGRALPRENMISINEACVTGITGLSMAAQKIQSGSWQRALVLGVDFRCTAKDLLQLHSLGALSTRPVPAAQASCPFSLERDGFVKSQGGAALLLENGNGKPSAAWGEIKGYGQTADAWRLTEGRPDGKSAAIAIQRAMKMAGRTPEEIDCFSAHATSTRIGDILETRLIKKVWGRAASKLPITALKSQIGHTIQASGLLQVIAALFMLREQKISPTINLNARDPECDLDYVPDRARPARLSSILCNSHAFGGQNACLILEKV